MYEKIEPLCTIHFDCHIYDNKVVKKLTRLKAPITNQLLSMPEQCVCLPAICSCRQCPKITILLGCQSGKSELQKDSERGIFGAKMWDPNFILWKIMVISVILHC